MEILKQITGANGAEFICKCTCGKTWTAPGSVKDDDTCPSCSQPSRDVGSATQATAEHDHLLIGSEVALTVGELTKSVGRAINMALKPLEDRIKELERSAHQLPRRLA